jgi:hypothetical protein
VVNLKAAGELLRSVADAGDRMQVSRRILDVAYKLDQARLGTGEPAPGEPAPGAPEPTETDIVPIESLQFDAPEDLEADVVPIATLAPDPASSEGDASGLEASFLTLERLQRERGSAPPSLDALVERTVDIGSLCYRGRSALERAATVRGALAAELAGVADLAAIRPLLQELLDLVPLALDER